MGRMGNILWWSEGEDCKSSPLLPIGNPIVTIDILLLNMGVYQYMEGWVVNVESFTDYQQELVPD